MPRAFVLLALNLSCYTSWEEIREREVRESIKYIQEQDKYALKKNLPLLYYVRDIEKDSAGGITMSIDIRNTSSKVIKYLHFYFVPYNAVGDIEKSEIGGQTEVKITEIGPLASSLGKEYDFSPYAGIKEGTERVRRWAPVWYNGSIACVKVSRIVIENMDKSKVTLRDKKVLDDAQRGFELFRPVPNSEYERDAQRTGLCKF